MFKEILLTTSVRNVWKQNKREFAIDSRVSRANHWHTVPDYFL